MDREATIGHIIAKELPADLVRLMKEQGSSPDKVERAASTLSNRKKRRAAGDLSNLFEVSASSAPTEQMAPPISRYGVFDRAGSACAIKCVCMHAGVFVYACIPAEGREFQEPISGRGHRRV